MKVRAILSSGAAAAILAFSAAPPAAAAIVYDLTSPTTTILAPLPTTPGVFTFNDLKVWGVVYDFGPNGNGGVGDATNFDRVPTYQDINGVGVCQNDEDSSQCKTNDTLDTNGGGQPKPVDRNEALVLHFDHEVTVTGIALKNFQENSRITFWVVNPDNSLTDLFEFDGTFGPGSPFSPPGFGSYTGTTFAVTGKGANHNGYQISGLTVEGETLVPEPSTWAMMIMGFGGVGALMRRRRMALA